MKLRRTGIIRRIDHLGRYIIPAELRKLHNINIGDALETFTNDDGDIVIRKFQLEDKLTESVKNLRNLIDSYGDTLPDPVAVALKKHTLEMLKLLGEE
jgi:AbrB family looped-hinge helix DNA binding protein